LLLHGYPQTHATWRLIAPRLAQHFALVIPDLRGYGESSGPTPDPDNVAYAKRTMALDMLRVMEKLAIRASHSPVMIAAGASHTASASITRSGSALSLPSTSSRP